MKQIAATQYPATWQPGWALTVFVLTGEQEQARNDAGEPLFSDEERTTPIMRPSVAAVTYGPPTVVGKLKPAEWAAQCVRETQAIIDHENAEAEAKVARDVALEKARGV